MILLSPPPQSLKEEWLFEEDGLGISSRAVSSERHAGSGEEAASQASGGPSGTGLVSSM